MNDTTTPPVVRTIDVNAPVEKAFLVFTEGMGTWWPFQSHSIFVDRAETAIFEPRVGGRVIERSKDGEEASWGEVLVYEPPDRLVLAWKPNSTPAPPTRVEVRFTATATGTHVELIHTGWEVLGDEAEQARRSYSEGWVPTLESFAGVADAI